jgi:class 3 adenylate cyclase
VEKADAAASELESIADVAGTTAVVAIAAGARGAVRLETGDAEAAIPSLRRALRGWQEIDAPYETAEVRVLLGKAYRSLGDDEGALLELRAARDAYERLGAMWAAEQTGKQLAGFADGEGAERVERTFVFTDIVRSTDLVEAMGDDAWADVLAWHDHTLRSRFAAHGGEVAQHTGDGFFVAFGSAASAARSAVAVQRALAEHRREHGFAPLVRIGIHRAQATRHGQDFRGAGVHRAARIAALADGGHILVSEEVAADVQGAFAVSAFREETLKGIAERVRVAELDWR